MNNQINHVPQQTIKIIKFFLYVIKSHPVSHLILTSHQIKHILIHIALTKDKEFFHAFQLPSK